METFPALLAICAWNSPVNGELPAQRPVTRSFDVFFDPRLNKRLSKQSWGWWYDTPSCPLWRHRDGHDIVHCGWSANISSHPNLHFHMVASIWKLVSCLWGPVVYHGNPLSLNIWIVVFVVVTKGYTNERIYIYRLCILVKWLLEIIFPVRTHNKCPIVQ